jgi:hypothetical protein
VSQYLMRKKKEKTNSNKPQEGHYGRLASTG